MHIRQTRGARVQLKLYATPSPPCKDYISVADCMSLSALCIRRTRTRTRTQTRVMLQVFRLMLHVFRVMLHVLRVSCNVTGNTCNITGNTCNITRNTCNITRVRVHVRVRRIHKASLSSLYSKLTAESNVSSGSTVNVYATCSWCI